MSICRNNPKASGNTCDCFIIGTAWGTKQDHLG